MRPIRLLAGVVLLAALVLLGSSELQSQDQGKAAPDPDKRAAKAQLPLYWDRLGLTDGQRDEVLKVTADYKEKREKLLDEIRKLDAESYRKRVAVLTEEQRKKLLDLIAGEEQKSKVVPKPKDK